MSKDPEDGGSVKEEHGETSPKRADNQDNWWRESEGRGERKTLNPNVPGDLDVEWHKAKRKKEGDTVGKEGDSVIGATQERLGPWGQVLVQIMTSEFRDGPRLRSLDCLDLRP